MKHDEMVELLKTVQCRDFIFRAYPLDTAARRGYLQVAAKRACAHTGGEALYVTGRKWMLSNFMTKSELVQTAFAAALAFEEHELREHFTYCGMPIFGPHFNVDDLVVLSKLSGNAGARP